MAMNAGAMAKTVLTIEAMPMSRRIARSRSTWPSIHESPNGWLFVGDPVPALDEDQLAVPDRIQLVFADQDARRVVDRRVGQHRHPPGFRILDDRFQHQGRAVGKAQDRRQHLFEPRQVAPADPQGPRPQAQLAGQRDQRPIADRAFHHDKTAADGLDCGVDTLLPADHDERGEDAGARIGPCHETVIGP